MRTIAFIAVVSLILTVSATAGAKSVYISTFDIEKADFSLTGFSYLGFPSPGPDNLLIDNMQGTYDLDIPATGMWDVYISGWIETQYAGTYDPNWTNADRFEFNEYVGTYLTPGPSTAWGPGSLEFVSEYEGTPYNFVLGYSVNLNGGYPSGSFGASAQADLTLWGDPGFMYPFNAYLTDLDNTSGGGDGIIDGWLRGEIAITAVPEPLTMLAVGMGIAGLAGYVRKRKLA